MNFNKIVIVGRLTKDPERKVSKDGKMFSNFTIAVNRNFKADEADFFDCVAFGNTADYILSYVRKGYLVLVEGSLQINKWADRDGVKHSKPEIIANVVKNFEKRKDDYGQNNNNEVMEKEDKTQEEEQLDTSEFEDDKLFDDLEDFSDDDFPLGY